MDGRTEIWMDGKTIDGEKDAVDGWYTRGWVERTIDGESGTGLLGWMDGWMMNAGNKLG